jgi:hypothetical protein
MNPSDLPSFRTSPHKGQKFTVAFLLKRERLGTTHFQTATSKQKFLKANSIKSVILIQKLRDWSERVGGLTRLLLGMGKGGAK